jgi:hypothetical protein
MLGAIVLWVGLWAWAVTHKGVKEEGRRLVSNGSAGRLWLKTEATA